MKLTLSLTLGLLLLGCALAQRLTKQQVRQRFERLWKNTPADRDLTDNEKLFFKMIQVSALEGFTDEGLVYARRAAVAAQGEPGRPGQPGPESGVFGARGRVITPLDRTKVNPFDFSNPRAASATLDERWNDASGVNINSAGGGRFSGAAGARGGEREPPRRLDPVTTITPLEFAERVADELGNRELDDLPVRKEYRCLTQNERDAFHRAVNLLKFNISMGDSDSAYNAFVTLHNMDFAPAAHIGPAFLPWHRHFLWLFERALKEASGDESMTLPYWDSSMDGQLGNPQDSILWTPQYMGTSDGPVTQGPFRNWQAVPASSGPLRRGVANHNNFLPDEATITDTQAAGTFAEYYEPLEFDVHNGPHMHIGGFNGGQMSNPTVSPNDPMFWMHHAFIDCLWEEWREEHQYPNNVDPVAAYPPFSGPHGGDQPMEPFSRLINTDGLSRIYTQLYYRCYRRSSCPPTDNTETTTTPRPVTCRHEGREYQVGETIPTGQRCVDCICRGTGEMSCARRSCPRINCQGSYWYTPRGQCCPVCAVGR